MTAASELNSAAVVQIESRKRKTRSPKADQKATSKTAVKAVQAVQGIQIEARSGSTTATVTRQVTMTTPTVGFRSAKATSGSTAALHSKAASLQATRLPVSVFPRIRPFVPAIQRNPVKLRRVTPEPFLLACCAPE